MTTFLVHSFLQLLRIWVVVVLASGASAEHGQHATLGVLVDLHEAIGEVIGTKGPSRVLCGSLNVRAYQQLAAVRWAVETINNNSWSNEFALDVVAHDTCGESGIALLETHQLIKWSKENIQDAPLIGVIVIGSRNNERVIDKPLETLNKENISAIVTSSRAAELLLMKHFNVFTTALDIASVTESILALIHQLGTDSVAVVSSCSHAVRKFEKLAAKESIPANAFSILKKDNPLILDAIIQFISNEAISVQTVVLLLDTSDVERLLRDRERLSQFRRLVRRKSWILGSVGIDKELAKEWSNRFQANLLIMQPHVSPNPDFQSYFLSNIQEALAEDRMDEGREYIERIHQCQWPEREMTRRIGLKNSVPKFYSRPHCGNLSVADLTEKFQPDSDVGFIVSAVSAYSAALRLAQLETCTPDEIGCDHDKLSGNVLEALRKLNFPIEATAGTPVDVDETLGPTIAASHELEGTRGRINHQGKLVSRKYDLLLSRPFQQIAQVGQYSSENGLLLDMTFAEVNLSVDSFTDDSVTEDEVIADSTLPTTAVSSSRQGKKTKSDSDVDRNPPIQKQHPTEPQVHMRKFSSPELYISRVWAMVVVAIGITGVFLALYMLVYVLLRMCDGTLQGNQSLGILLLLCVMLLYATVVIFVLPPSSLLCTLRVFVPSMALSVAFGILLLKAMQLRSLVSLGLGGRISTFNQFVTLLFIVAVQLAINLQFYFTPRASAVLPIPFVNDCSHSHETYLLLHSYLGLLILFVFLYGTSVLKIRRNYNEARWLTLTALLSLPVVLAWILVVALGPPEFQEPAPAIFFITIATIILFSIFIPKLGTISRQSSLVRRKQMLHQPTVGQTGGSISTIFTTLSDRGGGTLQQGQRSQQQHHQQQLHQHGRKGRHSSMMRPGQCSTLPASVYTLSPPPFSIHSSAGKSVTYSPRIPTNVHHSSSAPTSLTRSISMKTPIYDVSRGGYP